MKGEQSANEILLGTVKVLGMFSLEKRTKRDMLTDLRQLKQCHLDEGLDLFSLAPEVRTRINQLKCQGSRFGFDSKRNFLIFKRYQSMEVVVVVV